MVIEGTERVARSRSALPPKAVIELASLGVFGVLALAVLPDGIDGLHYARATSGRFNEKGSPMLQDKDKAQAMEWMADTMAPRTVVQVHQGMHGSWGLDWALHRPLRNVMDVPPPGPGEERYFVADLRFMNIAEQQRLFASFHVVAVGPFVCVDRQSSFAPATAYVFDEREPTFFEWYFTSPAEPIRTIMPDAYYTWELRDHFGQTPNAPPRDPPRTEEQIRIAHNVAVAQGDDPEAKRLEQELAMHLDRHVEALFSGGVRLLGQELHPGVAPELSLYFRAGGPLDNEYEFAVTSVVSEGKALSLVEPDDRWKQSGVPFGISPRAWRKGYLYAEHCDIRRRAGQEKYWGQFGLYKAATPPTAPRPTAGPPQIPLMVLP